MLIWSLLEIRKKKKKNNILHARVYFPRPSSLITQSILQENKQNWGLGNFTRSFNAMIWKYDSKRWSIAFDCNKSITVTEIAISLNRRETRNKSQENPIIRKSQENRLEKFTGTATNQIKQRFHLLRYWKSIIQFFSLELNQAADISYKKNGGKKILVKGH